MTPAEASPPRGFQRQGPVLRLDKRLLAGTGAAGWRLPVVVRPANEEAPVLEAARRRDALRHCCCCCLNSRVPVEFPVFDCEPNKGFDVSMHHHMQNSALY